MSPARFARYLPEAKGHRQLAIRLYIWNSKLCEAFYFPTQLAEVAARNAIHGPLIKRFTPTWYDSRAFEAILPERYENELKGVVRDQRKERGRAFTVDHVIGALTFGFWCNLLTSSYDNHLWAAGLTPSFPGSRGFSRQIVYDRIDQLRRFRNKIAHHYAIFDLAPRAELANTMDVIKLVCADTHWFVAELNAVERVLGRKPGLTTMNEPI